MLENRRFEVALIAVLSLAHAPSCAPADPVDVDREGGYRLHYHLDWDEALAERVISPEQYEDRSGLLTQTIEILRFRVEQSGMESVRILARGDDRFVVELPELGDGESGGAGAPTELANDAPIRSLIETLGMLKFYIAAEPQDFPSEGDMDRAVEQATRWREENPTAEWAVYNRLLASGEGKTRDLRAFSRKRIDAEGKTHVTGINLLWNPKEEWSFTDADLSTVSRSQDRLGHPAVGLGLFEERGADMGAFTREYVGRGLALVFDGVILILADIRSELGTDFLIEGQFTEAEVDAMVSLLRSGSLIVKPELERQEHVVAGGAE